MANKNESKGKQTEKLKARAVGDKGT